MIEGRCQKMISVPPAYVQVCQCSRAAVVNGKWCKQHDPEAVRARWKKSAEKAREQQESRSREQEKRTRDRMFEPVEGWVWCDMGWKAHRNNIGCDAHHRRLWVER